MLNCEQIAARIPHGGLMCLLSRVGHWDEVSIRCQAESHRAQDNPLRRNAMLSAVHLIEYAAQAMAVHGALCSDAVNGVAPSGVLASVRSAELLVERIDTIADDIHLEAKRLVGGDQGWLYAFTANASGRKLASGRLAIIFS